MHILPILSLLIYTAIEMITVIRVGTNAGVLLAKGAPMEWTVEMAEEVCGRVVTVGVSPVPCSSLPWNSSCTERELCSILMKPWKRSK